MPKVTTDVGVRIKTEGAAKAAADTQQLGQRSAEAMAKVNKEVSSLEGTFKKLTDKQLELNKLMSEMDDKGGKQYKALAKNMKEVQGEAAQVERTLKNVQRAYKQTDDSAEKAAQRRKRQKQQEVQDAKRGSFQQGLLQGLIPEAAYLQRGPGMARQAAGAAIGGRMRAGAAGLSQIPFSGAAGLAQAFQSVPGGGFLAAPMMQSVQYAQQALQFREQRQQMAPFLRMGLQGQGMVGETAAQQRNRLAKQVDADLASEPKISLARPPVEGLVLGRRTAAGEIWKQFKHAMGGGREDFGVLERRRAREVEAAGGEAAFTEAEREARIERAIAAEGGPRKQRRATLQDMLRSKGQRLGYALPEAMQMMGQITQAGGGVGEELMSQRLGEVGMAAQRQYGIGADVTGAFLQGGRRGGVIGGQGRGGAAMVDAIAGGMRMGLEGSELTQWMSQMAGDIRSWQQTGIEIKTQSINQLGLGMAKLGLGGVRGGVVARGMAARARDLSTRGPRGAEELILMQELGGLQGTGVEAFENAQLRMQEGGFGAEDVKRAMSRFMQAGGGGAGGRAVFRRAMRGFGVNIGIPEARLMEKQVMGGQLDKDEKIAMKRIDDQISAVAGGAPGDIDVLSRKAIKDMDPAVARQKAQQNQQLTTGNQMIKFMQDMEDTTRKVSAGFTTLAAAPLTKLSGGIKDLADNIPTLAKRLNAMTSGDLAGLVTPQGDQ